MKEFSQNQCGAPEFRECLLSQLGNDDDIDGDEFSAQSECAVCGRTVADLEDQCLSLGSRLSDSALDLRENAACLRLIEHAVVTGSSSHEQAVPSQIGVYQIRELLGRGGMGAVYRATHGRLKKDVAIKLLPTSAMAHPGAVARFEREMEAVGKLEHSNVVRALDAGEANGNSFLIMELVPGKDLGRLVANGRSLGIADACEIIRQAAVGLQYAHNQGMVHRDVKPANLMLVEGETGEAVIKVMDLGLALFSEVGSTSQLTDQGQLMGTLEFMAPEQATQSEKVDHRADIYALGATLFRLLTGSVPFDGFEFNTPVKRLYGLSGKSAPSVATRRTNLPAELVDLVDRMLSRDPHGRPQSMQDVADSLSSFSASHRLDELGCRLDADMKSPEMPAMRNPALMDTSPSTGATLREPMPSVLARPGAPDSADIQSDDELPPRRFRRTLAFAVSLPSLALFLGIIWLKSTDGSYVRIEADPSIDVAVNVLQEGEKVRTFRVGTNKGQFWLQSGNYEILLPTTQKDSLTIEGNRFTLTRMSQPVVKISRVTSFSRHVETTTGEVNGSTAVSLSPEQLDRNRRAIADFAFQNLGHVTIQRRDIGIKEDLPAGPFEIQAIGLKSANSRDVIQIAAMLPGVPECRDVYLNGGHGRGLTDEAMSAIGELTQLNRLVIETANVTDDGIVQWKSFPNLRTLGLLDLNITGKGLSHVAKVCPNLQFLGLYSDRMSGTDLNALSRFPNLRHLDLNTTVLNGAKLFPLGRMHLTRLTIRGSRTIESEAIRHIANSSIEWLLLQSAGINDQQLDMLTKCRTLQKLELAETGVTSEGLTRFKTQRPDVRVFVERRDSVTDSEVFQTRDSTLPSEPIDSRRVLAEWLLQNRSGFHTENALVRGRDAQVPVGIFKIVIVESHHTSDESMREVAELMANVPDCTRLMVFGARDRPMTDAGMKHLGRLSNLTQLHLQFADVTDHGLEELTGMTQLNDLSLVESPITSAGLRHIVKHHPLISTLCLRGKRHNVASLEALADLKHLAHMTFGSPALSTEFAACLAKLNLQNLTLLSIDSIDVQAIEALAASPRLQYLSIQQCVFEDQHLSALTKLESLQTLRISKGRTSPAGLKDFVSKRPDVDVIME